MFVKLLKEHCPWFNKILFKQKQLSFILLYFGNPAKTRINCNFKLYKLFLQTFSINKTKTMPHLKHALKQTNKWFISSVLLNKIKFDRHTNKYHKLNKLSCLSFLDSRMGSNLSFLLNIFVTLSIY